MVNSVNPTNNKTRNATIGGVALGAAGAVAGSTVLAKPKYDLGKLLTLEKDVYETSTKKASESTEKNVKTALETIKDFKDNTKDQQEYIKKLFTKEGKEVSEIPVEKYLADMEIESVAALKKEAKSLEKLPKTMENNIKLVETLAEKIKEGKLKNGVTLTQKVDNGKLYHNYPNRIKNKSNFKNVKLQVIMYPEAGEMKSVVKLGDKTIDAMKKDIEFATNDSKYVNNLLKALGGDSLKEKSMIKKETVENFMKEESKKLADDAQKAFGEIKNLLPKAKGKFAAIYAGVGIAAGALLGAVLTKSDKTQA